MDQIEAKGLDFIAKDNTQARMDVLKLKDHKLFFGTQRHPEYLYKVMDFIKPFLGLLLRRPVSWKTSWAIAVNSNLHFA